MGHVETVHVRRASSRGGVALDGEGVGGAYGAVSVVSCVAPASAADCTLECAACCTTAAAPCMQEWTMLAACCTSACVRHYTQAYDADRCTRGWHMASWKQVQTLEPVEEKKRCGCELMIKKH